MVISKNEMVFYEYGVEDKNKKTNLRNKLLSQKRVEKQETKFYILTNLFSSDKIKNTKISSGSANFAVQKELTKLWFLSNDNVFFVNFKVL